MRASFVGHYEITVKPEGTRNRRRINEQFRGGVILALLLMLDGCVPDQTVSLAACQKEADRFFMGYRNDDPENPRGRYIIECMAAKGYDFTVKPEACDSRYPLTTQATCYSRRGWVNWIKFELRRHL